MKRTPSQRWQDEIIARAREYREAEQRALEAIIKEHKGANARETTMAMARTIAIRHPAEAGINAQRYEWSVSHTPPASIGPRTPPVP